MPRKAPAQKPVVPDPLQDRGAVFDAALARGMKLPEGLAPEVARRFHVENPPGEWTEQDQREWLAHLRGAWQKRQDDPHWREMRTRIGVALRGRTFAKLDELPLRCGPALIHAKTIEALADALDAMSQDKERRESLEKLRRYAESDLQDAHDRMGFDPARFQRQEASALAAIEAIHKMQSEIGDQRIVRSDIMGDLTRDLFVIVRHVTPTRSVAVADGVSDKRIHAEAVTPILRDFASVDPLIPRRTARDGSAQLAPRLRLYRWLEAERRQSRVNAEIWRDGRQPETFDDLLGRARERLFAWDTRFDRALFETPSIPALT